MQLILLFFSEKTKSIYTLWASDNFCDLEKDIDALSQSPNSEPQLGNDSEIYNQNKTGKYKSTSLEARELLICKNYELGKSIDELALIYDIM